MKTKAIEINSAKFLPRATQLQVKNLYGFEGCFLAPFGATGAATKRERTQLRNGAIAQPDGVEGCLPQLLSNST
jgi:hypothetical protein